VYGRRAARAVSELGVLPIVGIASCVGLVLLFSAVAERIAYTHRVLPGVSVSGTSISGRSEAVALDRLETLAARLDAAPINVRAGDRFMTLDPSDVGLRVNAPATVRAAREAGRSRNPIEQVAGTMLRRVRPDHVGLRVHYDQSSLEGVLDAWTRDTAQGFVEGGLRFTGTTVVPVEPHGGIGIEHDAARHALDNRLHSAQRDLLTLPYGRIEPAVTAQQVADTATRARAVLASPVAITVGTATATLAPEQVATALRTVVDGHHLDLDVDPSALQQQLDPLLQGIVPPPVDASFKVTSTDAVQVVPSRPGRTVNFAAIASAIASGEHHITAPATSLSSPAHDTAWARALGIKELVSSFTTYYPPGQSRVTNIHHGADIINNLVVEPGQVFSLNAALGPRTPTRGFVMAPVFYDNDFTTDYGGGVSQLATTFFNAVFFGGYQDVEHQPHSIYISRYPMGRESTINYGTIDVKFRDDSQAGVLIRTSYTATSITVSFYGDKEGKVVTAEGPFILATQPPTTQYINWPLLPKGAQRFVSSGYTGYDVENFRVIQRPGQPPVRQQFSWHYDMLPNKVLVGTGGPSTTIAPGVVTSTTGSAATTTTRSDTGTSPASQPTTSPSR
jgi:vancomycin resistance protein YoaR